VVYKADDGQQLGGFLANDGSLWVAKAARPGRLGDGTIRMVGTRGGMAPKIRVGMTKAGTTGRSRAGISIMAGTGMVTGSRIGVNSGKARSSMMSSQWTSQWISRKCRIGQCPHLGKDLLQI
jgi:hypothetical protein